MADQDPKSRPQPAAPKKPEPSVYGDQWGSSGKQNDEAERGQTDRPQRIEQPDRPIGQPDSSNG